MTMTRFITTLLLATLLAGSVLAVAPTQEAIEKWKAEGKLGTYLEQRREAMKLGFDQPNERPVIDRRAIASRLAAGVQAADTLRVVVLLVDFSDNPMDGGSQVGSPAKFDSILFSDQTLDPPDSINPTGSMTDYYKEATYDQIYLKGDIFGPFRMPQPYSYYVADDNGIGKSPELVATAVNLADPAVNFADYARDGSHCDGLVIIHAGRGAEEGVYGIWSHKWNLQPSLTKDGVLLSNYTMNPEESGTALSPIGVFCHEYGHFLGLPDLYDINDDTGTSLGLGSWSLMATGNYLGGSKKPAHFDPYCREQIGVISYTEVTANLHQAPITDATTSPVVYRLRNAASGSNEYWLVENRQKTGFDLNLPGAGLCVYHVDDNVGGSNHLPVYHVAMEQADGNFDLEYTTNNSGDGGDPFPGATNNRSFNDFTTPNTFTNGGFATGIAIWDISDAASTMYADLDIEPSRPLVQLQGTSPIRFNDDAPRGDGDGIPEAGETVQVYVRVNNLLRTAYNPRLTVTTNNPYITFTTPSVTYDNTTLSVSPLDNTTPVEFTVADSLIPVIDSFFLTVTTDSLNSTPGSDEFAQTFGVEKQIGAANVLVIDDDRGDAYEDYYTNSFYKVRVPTQVWHVNPDGLPTLPDMQQYGMVFWHMGRDTLAGDIDATRIALMKSYLDGGGNLMLSAMQGISDINTVDAGFLSTYFRASYGGSAFYPTMLGVGGTQIGDNTKYFFRNDFAQPSYPTVPWVNVLSGGEGFLYQSNAATHYWGVSYNSGTYKTALLTFPAEFVNSELATWSPLDTLIGRITNFFGGIPTSIYDGSPFTMLPQSFDLVQNFPNPFNPTTTIQYTLRDNGSTGSDAPRTRLVIYNALGQQVKTLVDKVQIPGKYSGEWDGRTDGGSKVASGIYFYRLERAGEAQTKKMVLLK